MANLNTAAAARDEGDWDYVSWQPRIASSGAFDTFVDLQLTRANAELRYRVGYSFYDANVAVTTPPWAAILKSAEMHLGQAYLLIEAAAIAETGGDTNPAPFLGSSATIGRMADQRMALFEHCVALTRGVARPGERIPVCGVSSKSAVIVNRFSPTIGDPNP